MRECPHCGKEVYMLSYNMPYKGRGIFRIADPRRLELTYAILKEHVGEWEFTYCPNNFIKTTETDLEHYGKFQIEDLRGLYNKLSKQGIVVVEAAFFP